MTYGDLSKHAVALLQNLLIALINDALKGSVSFSMVTSAQYAKRIPEDQSSSASS